MNRTDDAANSAGAASMAAVALGSNIPPREAALRKAVSLLGRLPGTRVRDVSRIFETEPQGGPPQGPFLNAAALLDTHLDPHALLDGCLAIEKELGRSREGKNFPRTIDLDIIFYDEKALTLPGLEIPHPRFRERGFVLQPLADIIPGFEDPVTSERVDSLLREWLRAGGSPAQGRNFRTG